jgi:hypothetical protein
LIAKDPEGMSFQLGAREKDLLCDLLSFYPLVPPAHHRLHQSPPAGEPDENQRLLEEALAEQRRENQRAVRALLDDPARFQPMKPGLKLRLTHAEVERLLQILNDVRVGGWLALGSPEPGAVPKVTPANLQYHLAMEAGGLFESALLAALGVQESPEWTEE